MMHAVNDPAASSHTPLSTAVATLVGVVKGVVGSRGRGTGWDMVANTRLWLAMFCSLQTWAAAEASKGLMMSSALVKNMLDKITVFWLSTCC